VDWGTILGTVTGAVVGMGATALRYQMSITAPPTIVALSDETLRGLRNVTEKLHAGRTYDSWDELRADNQAWFAAFTTMRHLMRRDLDGDALPLPSSEL
jgi:hypothetical protein